MSELKRSTDLSGKSEFLEGELGTPGEPLRVVLIPLDISR